MLTGLLSYLEDLWKNLLLNSLAGRMNSLVPFLLTVIWKSCSDPRAQQQFSAHAVLSLSTSHMAVCFFRVQRRVSLQLAKMESYQYNVITRVTAPTFAVSHWLKESPRLLYTQRERDIWKRKSLGAYSKYICHTGSSCDMWNWALHSFKFIAQ